MNGAQGIFVGRPYQERTACWCAEFLICDLGECGRGAAGAGARGGSASGSVGGCRRVEYSGEGKFGGGRGSQAVERRGGQRVVAWVAGAGGGSGNDGLAGGEDGGPDAGHGAVMRAVAAAAGRQAGVIVSQGRGQRAEQEEEQEQNGSATPHVELSLQEAVVG